MKKRFLISLLVLLMIVIPICAYAEEEESNYEPNIVVEYKKEEQEVLDNVPKTGCKAVYIAEPITGKVIYEKNAHEVMYPASTTKILTALVVMEKCKLDDTAIVSKNAIDLVPSGYSNANLQVGEEFTIKDLLYALLIPSANEAANVLAEHVSGSVEAFADLCNSRAKELGCENLHFVNPNGIHNDNHSCTAYDLYLIARECQKYEIFNEIVKTTSYTLPSTAIYPGTRTIKNTNELLFSGTYFYANCTGIKTGTTTPAGQCLVASSSYNGLDLICVVLGGGTKANGLSERFYDTKEFFDFCYDNYSVKEIAEYGDLVEQLDVGKATKSTKILNVVVDTNISTIVPNNVEKESIKTEVKMDNNIVAPIKQNQVLGRITYYADGLEYTTNVIASHPVEKLPYIKYNLIIAGSLVVTLIFFVTLLMKCKKKNRKKVLLIWIIVFIIQFICMIRINHEGYQNSITRVNTNVKKEDVLENQSEDVQNTVNIGNVVEEIEVQNVVEIQ